MRNPLFRIRWQKFQIENATIGEVYTCKRIFVNTSGKNTYFEIKPEENHRYVVKIDPSSYTLKPGYALEVNFNIMMLCTTSIEDRINILTIEYDEDEEKNKEIEMITIYLDSKSSNRLDYTELKLQFPKIGMGDFGVIYKGTYRNENFAVKKMKLSIFTQQKETEFNREINILTQYRHSCILNCFGATFTENEISIVTEVSEFGSLDKLLGKETISYDLKVKILEDISVALSYLHSNFIIHRDVKCEHILLFSMYPYSQVCSKLIDFGTARRIDQKTLEQNPLTSGIGTITYMAPECLGNNDYDFKADVYSFGVVMYELIIESFAYEDDERFNQPFMIPQFVIEGNRLERLDDIYDDYDINDDYWNLIEQCWNQEPEDRPSFPLIYSKLKMLKNVNINHTEMNSKIDKKLLDINIDEYYLNQSIDSFFLKENNNSYSIPSDYEMMKETKFINSYNPQYKPKQATKDEIISSLPYSNSQFPLKLSSWSINFDKSENQIGSLNEYIQEITVLNPTKDVFSFKIFIPTSEKYYLEVEPQFNTLKSNQSCKIIFKLNCSCSTTIEEDIGMVVVDKNGFEKSVSKIKLHLKSENSIYLDPDDLKEDECVGGGLFTINYLCDFKGNKVNMKKFRENLEDIKELEEFEKEVEMLDKFRSDYIIHFIGAVSIPKKHCIVTEFPEYGSIRDMMDESTNEEGIPHQLKVKLMLDASRGIQYLHDNGILHRNIKPENLLVVSLDRNVKVNCKLTDFGSSRNVNMMKSNKTFFKILYYVAYLAPEILRKDHYKMPADIFSFAITMYETFNWRFPYPKTQFRFPWKIAEFIKYEERLEKTEMMTQKEYQLINQCWCQNPKDRLKSEDVVAMLETFILEANTIVFI